MAKTATVRVRMEPELKKQAEELFEVLGISLCDAFRIFAKQSVRDCGMPFKVTTEPPYAAELLQRIKEMERGEYETFDTVEELFADLNDDDDEDEDEEV